MKDAPIKLILFKQYAFHKKTSLNKLGLISESHSFSGSLQSGSPILRTKNIIRSYDKLLPGLSASFTAASRRMGHNFRIMLEVSPAAVGGHEYST